MSTSDELYGINEETYERLIAELEKEITGKKKREAVREMINKLSVDKRDQRETVVLAVMLGMVAAK